MRLNLRAKLLLPISLAVTVILLCVVFITTSVVENQFVTNFNEELRLMSNALAKNVSNSAAGYKRDMVSLAATNRLKEHISAIIDKDTQKIEATQQSAENVLKDYMGFYSYFPVMNIAGPDGLVIFGTNKAAIGKVNVGQRGYFKQSMQGKTAISEPIMSMDTKDKAVVVSAPIIDDSGKVIAVLYGVLPLKNVITTTIEGISIGNSGFAYIIDSSGLMLAHKDYKMVQEYNTSTTEWGKQVLAGTSGQLSYTTPDGVQRLMAYERDKESGWITLVCIEESEISSAISMLRNIIFALMGAGLVLVIFTVFLVLRPIIRDLLLGMNFATAVAGGDLDKTFTVSRTDEMGALFDSLRAMVANLKSNIESARQESARAREQSEVANEAMQNAEAASTEAQAKTQALQKTAIRLEEVASIVSSASAQLSSQIQQSEHGASEQASRMTETATSMEEMNSTVLEVAKNAGSAAEISTATRQKAESGAEVVRKSLKSIQDVQKQSIQLRDDMGKLDENAQAISQIMGVISDIADQTNLLALNAAIEAARAGEAGRGFAVVADEVRKLAEKTMASTTDVGNAIKAIQQSATESVEQVNRSVKFIEEATEYANLSGKALDEIVSMVDATADQVQAIATASEQQSSTSDEINRSITTVNGIASETARAMNEAARAVNNLADQAAVLARLIDDMKNG